MINNENGKLFKSSLENRESFDNIKKETINKEINGIGFCDFSNIDNFFYLKVGTESIILISSEDDAQLCLYLFRNKSDPLILIEINHIYFQFKSKNIKYRKNNIPWITNFKDVRKCALAKEIKKKYSIFIKAIQNRWKIKNITFESKEDYNEFEIVFDNGIEVKVDPWECTPDFDFDTQKWSFGFDILIKDVVVARQ